jgi:hypothetical protein
MNAIAVVLGTKTVFTLRVLRVGICGTDRDEATGSTATMNHEPYAAPRWVSTRAPIEHGMISRMPRASTIDSRRTWQMLRASLNAFLVGWKSGRISGARLFNVICHLLHGRKPHLAF